ncbi:MAG: ADP-ribosylglycohydrolase family protein [Muribaculaceae bacterium]|nr:ADP-ribosylglycohydrolase family protein [Muribaculaceae bacterium]
MLGAVAGDIIGSVYEFTEQKRYDFELFTKGSRFTDDSVMTIAIAHWLVLYDKEELSHEHLIKCMQMFGRKYPFAGYGSSFNSWLWSEHPLPYNSWGNGAAMRVSPVGLYADTLDEVLELAKRTAEVSHNHPEGVRGAQAVAVAVWMAKHGYTKEEIKDYITKKFKYDLERTVDEIRHTYQWEVSCQGSVPESIICFLEGRNFEEVVRLAISLGGDADTMACIAGSIAACMYPIPESIVKRCESLLTQELCDIMKIFELYLEVRPSLEMLDELNTSLEYAGRLLNQL